MAERKSTSDKAAELAERFDVELADGPGGVDPIPIAAVLQSFARLLLDLAAKQAARAGGKSAG